MTKKKKKKKKKERKEKKEEIKKREEEPGQLTQEKSVFGFSGAHEEYDELARFASAILLL